MKTIYLHFSVWLRHLINYKFWLLHCLLLLLSFTLQAQVKEWDKTFGGDQSEAISSLQQTTDGGYILGGSSESSISGNKTAASRGGVDYWVVKTNSAGNKEWDKAFGGSENEFLTSLHQTKDGGYILGGFSESGISGNKTEANRGSNDYWIVKLNADGIKEWDRTFGGDGDDQLFSIQLTSDGGYILGGLSYSGISGDKTDVSRGEADFWVIKINANGNKEWDRTYGGASSDGLAELQQTNDGGYILGGFSNSGISGDKTQENKSSCTPLCSSDYWVIKLDAAGNKEWDRTLGGADFDNLSSIVQTNDNGFVLGGSSNSDKSGDKSENRRGNCDDYCHSDYWVVKLDASGNKEWDKTYGGNRDDVLQSLIQTVDGGFILGGSSDSDKSGDKTEQGPGDSEFWIVKLDEGGNKLWDRTFGGDFRDFLFSVQQTQDGGYILGGRSESPISGDKTENSTTEDFWVVKLSAEALCSLVITVIPDPVSYIGGDPKTIILGTGHQRVTLQASGADRYEWNPVEGLSDPSVENPIFTPTSPGPYHFTVTGFIGNGACTSTATASINVVDPTIAGNKEWDRTFGGENWDGLRDVQQTNDGGYILGGFSRSGRSGDKTEESRGNEDMWIVKLDSAGSQEWDRTFGGSEQDELNSLQQTTDGGYILGGRSSSGTSGDKTKASRGGSDYWVIKLNTNGNIEWDRTFGGSEIDVLESIHQTSDGGYILGGHSWSGRSGDKSEPNRGFSDYWVVKLNASGNKEWDKTFGGFDRDHLTSIQQTSDGGYILGGLSGSGVSGDKTEPNRGFEDELSFDYWVVKINGSGEKEWDKTYGGIYDEALTSLQQTSDGGYLLGGYSGSESTGDKSEANRGFEDFWVVKLDAHGNKEWDKTIGGDDEDFLRSLQQTSDGGYILGGISASGISGDKSEANRGEEGDDFWVVKINATGNKEWDRTFGGTGDEGLSSLKQTRDGGYILAGSSNSNISGDKTEDSHGNYDFWVVKISGEPGCTPPAPSIAPIPSSNVYTGGDPATIYLGYGPQSVRLQASGGERYEWSPATGLNRTDVADPVFTATAAGTYTFTLTAFNGSCHASETVTINVVDARCNNGKVLVCHNGRLLCLAPPAVQAHLRNHKGDQLGNCSPTPLCGDEGDVKVALRVYPNPFRDRTSVEFSLAQDTKYRLELYSASGKMLGVIAQGQARSNQLLSKELRAEKLREGIYYVRLITDSEVQTVRLVLKK